MSIFATKVGLATPRAKRASHFVEIALANGTSKSKEAGVVQAVSFPFVVTGPLFVRSVNGGGDDEERDVLLPNGSYDVLARFFSKRASKRDGDAGLREFRVTLDFHPAPVRSARRSASRSSTEQRRRTFS